eukprot:gnl/MRDRNA2_/MRDRNA2_188673_c0_seq1.p1 gnl/MRDRNA2_/MRDRNA2_188673_c0~~gnl/MRDRNA2_/MRDRNA2_188673_c0_seq1.p1  ORF type:complete len:303 (+),score=56.54 gnl/MRDRNA2_/MRDRNA2_188673_c0_seq1:109-1017(+)
MVPFTSSFVDQHHQSLRTRGLSIVDSLIGDGGHTALTLRKHLLSLYSLGKMRAGVVQSAGTGEQGSVKDDRGDFVVWLSSDKGKCDQDIDVAAGYIDKSEAKESQICIARLEAHMHHLVKEIDEGLVPGPIMGAIYPPGRGAQFRTHVDNPEGDGRRITAVYYINVDWQIEDGATLRAWTSGSASHDELVEIAPVADRLVLFDAEKVYHAVTPNVSEDLTPGGKGYRCALTLWFSCPEEAAAFQDTHRRSRWQRRQRNRKAKKQKRYAQSIDTTRGSRLRKQETEDSSRSRSPCRHASSDED